MTLNQLFNKYGSDKGDATPEGHNYGPFYEATLPKNPKRMLEIGVHKGASARAWKEWFPEVEFHGLDLFSEHSEPTDIPGAVWHKGNQTDYALLEILRALNFDIIIDDGSHCSRHMMISFYGLFKPGTHYYIEDLMCNRHEFYRQDLPEDLTVSEIFRPDFVGPCYQTQFQTYYTEDYKNTMILIKAPVI